MSQEIRGGYYEDTVAIAQNRFANSLLAIGNAILASAIIIFLGSLIYGLL